MFRSSRELMTWQRVRDSNPCTGLERALMYSCNIPIISLLQLLAFLLLHLLLCPFALFRRLLSVSARRVSG